MHAGRSSTCSSYYIILAPKYIGSCIQNCLYRAKFFDNHYYYSRRHHDAATHAMPPQSIRSRAAFAIARTKYTYMHGAQAYNKYDDTLRYSRCVVEEGQRNTGNILCTINGRTNGYCAIHTVPVHTVNTVEQYSISDLHKCICQMHKKCSYVCTYHMYCMLTCTILCIRTVQYWVLLLYVLY